MSTLLRRVARFMFDLRGATATEYAFIAAVMGGAVIQASTTLGTSMSSAFTSIGTALTTKAAGM